MLASEAMKKLKTQGIGTRPFFWPMNEQNIFKKFNLFTNEKYPNSHYLSRYGFYIPSHLKIKNLEMDYIITAIKKLF